MEKIHQPNGKPLPEAPLPAQVNQGLQGGIECLFQLVTADQPIGCSEVARALGMELTRANRLLGTLAAMGIAQRTRDRKYIPGAGLHLLSALSLRGSHLLSSALPVLRNLAEETGCGVALGILWQTQVCYLFHGKTGDLGAAIAPSNLYPAEESSIGRVLLSFRPEDDIRQQFSNHPDIDTLLDKLARARERGFAFSSDENSLAAAVDNPPVAGLAIMNYDAENNLDTLVQFLHESADKIADNMNRK